MCIGRKCVEHKNGEKCEKTETVQFRPIKPRGLCGDRKHERSRHYGRHILSQLKWTSTQRDRSMSWSQGAGSNGGLLIRVALGHARRTVPKTAGRILIGRLQPQWLALPPDPIRANGRQRQYVYRSPLGRQAPYCIGCPDASTPLPVPHGWISGLSRPAFTIGSS